jgi:hypothetical protein
MIREALPNGTASVICCANGIVCKADHLPWEGSSL